MRPRKTITKLGRSPESRRPLENTLDSYVTSDVRLREEVGRRIQSLPGTQAVTPIRYFPVEWKTGQEQTENLTFMALDVNAYTRVTSFVFRGTQVDQQQAIRKLSEQPAVFVSSVLAEKYHLTLGDSIRLRAKKGFVDFQIAGVVVDFYNQGLVVQGSWETMRRFYNIRDSGVFLVKIKDGESVDRILSLIDSQYGRRYHLSLISNESIRVRVGTLMGVIGGLLGLATGIVLARILFIGMTTMSGYELTFTLPPDGLVISLIVALIVSQLAVIPPALRAARVRIIEALQYE